MYSAHCSLQPCNLEHPETLPQSCPMRKPKRLQSFIQTYATAKNHDLYIKGAELEAVSAITDLLGQLPLPKTQEELHDRMILFQILKETEAFLRVKKEFISSLTAEQKSTYLENTPA